MTSWIKVIKGYAVAFMDETWKHESIPNVCFSNATETNIKCYHHTNSTLLLSNLIYASVPCFSNKKPWFKKESFQNRASFNRKSWLKKLLKNHARNLIIG